MPERKYGGHLTEASHKGYKSGNSAPEVFETRVAGWRGPLQCRARPAGTGPQLTSLLLARL